MRLWHQKLISKLPRQQLLGQHRECCALRGAGWGRKHSVVDYVFTHRPERLVAYHLLVMDEMLRRNYHPDIAWMNPNWRGNTIQEQQDWCDASLLTQFTALGQSKEMIYPEHDEKYLQECLENLKNKNIIITIDKEED